VCVSGCTGGAPCAAGFDCVDGACLPAAGSVVSGVRMSGFVGLSTASVAMNPGVVMRCLPRPLEAAADMSVPCSIMQFAPGGSCDCSTPGFQEMDPLLVDVARRILRDSGRCDMDSTPPCASLCGCEVLPFGSGTTERTDCLSGSTFGFSRPGYCYVDPQNGWGDPSAVATCPVNQQQAFRFAGSPTAGKFLVLACLEPAMALSVPASPPGLGRVGAACMPNEEQNPAFPGYQISEVMVDGASGDCATNVCLINHFRGRVSCPYGNVSGSGTCFTPDAEHQLVTATVDPQIATAPEASAGRRPDQAVYCSCRCDGPDPAAEYCQCPTGFECAALMPDIGKGHAAYAGSYCVKLDTNIGPAMLNEAGAPCTRPPGSPGNCGP
jgi:hypothetical protein